MTDSEIPKNFIPPGSSPNDTAADQMRGIIITATGQVERKNLHSMTYELEITDQHGNTVKGGGVIYGNTARDDEFAPVQRGVIGWPFRRGR